NQRSENTITAKEPWDTTMGSDRRANARRVVRDKNFMRAKLPGTPMRMGGASIGAATAMGYLLTQSATLTVNMIRDIGKINGLL
ncbi:hypothetical protein MGP2080_08541, partial [marine gamma proteobacterium HTCC2080]